MAGMYSPSFKDKGKKVRKSFNPALPEGPDNMREELPPELQEGYQFGEQDYIDSSNPSDADLLKMAEPSSSPSPSSKPVMPKMKSSMPVKKKKQEEQDLW